MRAAVYARVSTTRQAQAQTIEQQLDRLRAAVAGRGWVLDDQHVYRDDGYSGARLGRPGLDRLRDHAALADLDVVLVTAPDRLARNYVHQVLLIEELAGHGCRVEFLDRPMSNDPHDQLLLQIRGAVAEYERTLIAERMRRGRQAKLRAGTLLPWTRPPFGYRLDPGRPRDAAAVRVEPGEAVLVAQLFDWYLEPRATLYQLAARLTGLGVATPTGKPRWNVASVRGILRNPAYAGRALTNRTQVAPARRRKSALRPAGRGISHAPRPEQDWIEVPVPPVVSAETFARVQAKLDTNQQSAARNTRHEYLLRALVSCGACRLACTGRQTGAGYRYYLCRGRTAPLHTVDGRRCTARYIPAGQLDELVWADLCALLTDPAHIARALDRARGGAWLPQELQARQAAIGQALSQLDRQQQRLLEAYLAEVIGLPEFQRKREELDRRQAALAAQQRQLDAAAGQRLELQAVADGIEAFCQTVRARLAAATFEQRRQLAELLIDRVIVTGDQVEIRYVLPTSPDGPHRPFCQLRKDHLDRPAKPGHLDQGGQRDRLRGVAVVEGQFPGAPVPADQQAPVSRSWVVDGDPCPVVPAVSFGAGPRGQPLPGLPGQAGGQLIGAEGAPGTGGDPVIAGDREHVRDAPGLQPGAQRPVVPGDLVPGHPGERHRRARGLLDHPPSP
jgi:site-specific DNA recombinase